MVKTRFAPSPTGYLHVGGARTALFSWLCARSMGGQFVLRIEDTDQERSTQASIDAIMKGMEWLGLDYDEGPYYQTQRLERYQEVIEHLLTADRAYRCYCSRERLERLREEQMARQEKPRYDGRCRDNPSAPASVAPVIRFRNPTAGAVSFADAVRGHVTHSNTELDDLVIARGNGLPTYNFCVVVDDLDMGITHVVRGDDHVNNTPRQINILKALSGEQPAYAHVPMILGADGQRLSKRHGAVSVMQFKDEGYLPQALTNYLVRLGWSHGDQEIFSRQELIELFTLDAVNRAPSSFDMEKLNWLNRHYLKEADIEELAGALGDHLRAMDVALDRGPDLAGVVLAQRERAKTLVDMATQSAFYFTEPTTDEQAAKKHLRPVISEPLSRLRARLEALDEWSEEALHACVAAAAAEEEIKLAKLAQPLRVALSGRAATPPIDVTLALVGKARTLARIDAALQFIAAREATA
ncbi:MAG: glutamate--tRNA ligase [Gammaproteobacteria bacterium]|nr:glutamate--tRNA ligase [Gammaproteobacteria bacterium]